MSISSSTPRNIRECLADISVAQRPGVRPSRKRLLRLLAEAASWIGLSLSPAERELLEAGLATGASGIPSDPNDYIALPVTLGVQPQGAVANTPQGDMLILGCQLTIPLANFRHSPVLSADGAVNPARGMLPMLNARFVVPRERLSEDVLRRIEGGATGEEEAQCRQETPTRLVYDA